MAGTRIYHWNDSRQREGNAKVVNTSKTPDAGYDGEAGGADAQDGLDTPVVFTLEKVQDMFSGSGVRARILRNGEPCGIFHLKHEWEFTLLRAKINGDYFQRGFVGLP